MEYRGVEYRVVQTINKTWRWTVKRDHNDKVGTSPTRESAVTRAQQFINELIKSQSKAARGEDQR